MDVQGTSETRKDTETSIESKNQLWAPGSLNPSVASIPKKRGRKPKDVTGKAKPSNVVERKTDSASANLPRKRQSRLRESYKLPTPGNPVWKASPVSLCLTGISTASDTSDSGPRPRQWCSSKEELLAILPELAVPKLTVNFPVPTILIEETEGMSLSDPKLSDDKRMIELRIARDFACMTFDLTELPISAIPSTASKTENPELLSTCAQVNSMDSGFDHSPNSVKPPPATVTLPLPSSENVILPQQPKRNRKRGFDNTAPHPSVKRGRVDSRTSIVRAEGHPGVSLLAEENCEDPFLKLASVLNGLPPSYRESRLIALPTESRLTIPSLSLGLNDLNMLNYAEMSMKSGLPDMSSLATVTPPVIEDTSAQRFTPFAPSTSSYQPLGPQPPPSTADFNQLAPQSQFVSKVPIKLEVSDYGAESLIVAFTLAGENNSVQPPASTRMPSTKGRQRVSKSSTTLKGSQKTRSKDTPGNSMIHVNVSINPPVKPSSGAFTNPTKSRRCSRINHGGGLSQRLTRKTTELTSGGEPPADVGSSNRPVTRGITRATRERILKRNKTGSSLALKKADGAARPIRTRSRLEKSSEPKLTIRIPAKNTVSSGLLSPLTSIKDVPPVVGWETMYKVPSPPPSPLTPLEDQREVLFDNPQIPASILKHPKFSPKKNGSSSYGSPQVNEPVKAKTLADQKTTEVASLGRSGTDLGQAQRKSPNGVSSHPESECVMPSNSLTTETQWVLPRSFLKSGYLPNGPLPTKDFGQPSHKARPLYQPSITIPATTTATTEFAAFRSCRTPDATPSSSSSSVSMAQWRIPRLETSSAPILGLSSIPDMTNVIPSSSSISTGRFLTLFSTHAHSTPTSPPSSYTGHEPVSIPSKLVSFTPKCFPVGPDAGKMMDLPLTAPLPAEDKRSWKRKIGEVEQNPVSGNKRPHLSIEQHVADEPDLRVPTQLPQDVQILVDAYCQNTPVLTITSRNMMLAYCGKSINGLSPEFQYMYMGFFKVTSVKEERVFRPSADSASGILVSSEYSFGKVQYTFGLEWIAAGEEDLQLPMHLNLDRPWWCDATDWKQASEKHVAFHQGAGTEFQAPVNTTLTEEGARSTSLSTFREKGSNLIDSPLLTVAHMGDEDSQSTPRFRKRRQADQNYASRNKPMAPRCPSIVWLALQASTFDSLNWYCNSCGKLNRQRFFRRRKCSSSFCMDAPITACRVQQLEHIRFIGQQSPLVLPLNNMPKYIDLFTVITEWDDGMRTVAYPVWNKNIMERILEEAEEQIHSVASPFGPCIFPGGISTADFASRTVKQEALEYLPSNNVPEVTRVERILQSAQVYGLPHLAQHIRDIENKKKVMAKHLFTCNDPRLQDEQTELLGSIQETLVLQKMALDNSPYFSYVAGLVHGNSFASDYINSNVQPVPWEDAPPCIEQARGLMHHLATVYGEISELPLLTQLTVLGWTATGRKKGEHCLRAKEKTIVIMVLGHELGVRIVPKSGFPANSLRLNKVDIIKTEPVEASIVASQSPSFMAVRSDVVVTDNLDVPSAGVTTMVESLERPAPVLVSQLGSAASTETAQHPTMLGYYSDEVHPSIMTKDLPEHTSTWEAAVVTEANLEGLIRMASDPLELFEPYDEEITNNEEDICDTKSSWLGGVEKDFEADGVDESQRRRVTTKRATAVKEDMQFLLVHGDVLLLSGDDFDYGIERKGMGLLLVGST